MILLAILITVLIIGLCIGFVLLLEKFDLTLAFLYIMFGLCMLLTFILGVMLVYFILIEIFQKRKCYKLKNREKEIKYLMYLKNELIKQTKKEIKELRTELNQINGYKVLEKKRGK